MRRTNLVSLLVPALAALACAACGDDDDGSSSSAGGGGSGSTTTTSSSTSSTQSGGGEGGGGEGGSGEGGSGEGGGTGGAGGETGSGGAGGAGGEGGAPAEAFELVVSANPANRDLDAVARVSLDLQTTAATIGGLGDVTSLQNVALTDDGDAFVAYDAPGGTGGLMFVAGLADAASGALGGGTRRVEGPATGLQTPKGVEVLEEAGLVLVADTAARDIKIFAVDDEGDVAPVAIVDSLGGNDRAVWDVDYDPAADRLYAAGTDGVVLVFDGFADDMGASGPTRTFTPAVDGAAVSVNLHGIQLVTSGLVLPETILVLSDVGDPAVATDGQIFTVDGPDTASGLVDVRGRLVGGTTMLGNPVDLVVDGTTLVVAEKSNDALLEFADVFGIAGTQSTAPSASTAFVKPESVALVADLLGNETVAVANPAGRDADAVVRLNALAQTVATLGAPGVLQSIQSTTLDADGTAYISVDLAGSTGGIVVVDDVVSAASLGVGSRRIAGAATGLLAPKGLVVATVGDVPMLLVADTGTAARDVKAFALDASGDTAPLFTVADLGADRAPWDVAYDADGDRLYVAATDGVVLVYDDFSTVQGGTGPTRTFTPAVGGVDVAVNLHGIELIAGTDVLVVSDVGDAAVGTDGQVFVIDGASTAEGLVDVTARLVGAATLLGNPVDVALDGDAIHVAEKSQDRLLRWDGALTLTGDLDVAADASVAFTKPESVFVRLD